MPRRYIESGLTGRNLQYTLYTRKGILLPNVYTVLVVELHPSDPGAAKIRHDLTGSFPTLEQARLRIENLPDLE